MKRLAIGIRVHSGWGALVALSGQAGSEEVVERSRVTIVDPHAKGTTQPYHFAERMNLADAEKHIGKCAADSERLALSALSDIFDSLRERGYAIAGSAILLSSGRPLPGLAQILASHALIHAAEGEFFRHAFRESLERLHIPVTGIRERELEQHAVTVFGKAAPQIMESINSLGRSLGPPWTQDQKIAALAAATVLALPA